MFWENLKVHAIKIYYVFKRTMISFAFLISCHTMQRVLDLRKLPQRTKCIFGTDWYSLPTLLQIIAYSCIILPIKIKYHLTYIINKHVQLLMELL